MRVYLPFARCESRCSRCGTRRCCGPECSGLATPWRQFSHVVFLLIPQVFTFFRNRASGSRGGESKGGPACQGEFVCGLEARRLLFLTSVVLFPIPVVLSYSVNTAAWQLGLGAMHSTPSAKRLISVTFNGVPLFALVGFLYRFSIAFASACRSRPHDGARGQPAPRPRRAEVSPEQARTPFRVRGSPDAT